MSNMTSGLDGFREAHSMLSFVEWQYDSSAFWNTAAPWQKAVALQRSWKIDPESIPAYWVALGKPI